MLALAQLVMNIIVLNDMSRTFGKDAGYTIGLAIFGFVFWTMLGFGSSEAVDLDDNEDELVRDVLVRCLAGPFGGPLWFWSLWAVRTDHLFKSLSKCLSHLPAISAYLSKCLSKHLSKVREMG